MHHFHENPTSWTDILTAIGTVGAVILTVFFFLFERIRNWIKRPKLEMGVNFTPPECHKTIVMIGNEMADAYWFRLFATNVGNTPAKDIEVTIDKVYKKIGDKWTLYSAFLPSSLVWTHINQPILNDLIPGTTRNIDLGYIMDPEVRYKYQFENNPVLPNSMTEILFNVSISVKPFIGYNIIESGEYKFLLIIGAKNCKPFKDQIILKFTNDWKDDETKMLNETVKISKKE